MKRFRIGRVPGPINRPHHGLRLLLQLPDEGSEAFGLLRINFFAHQ